MKKRFSRKLSIFGFLAIISIFVGIMCFTQAYAEPKVTLVGTILPLNEKGELNTFVLWNKAEKWNFEVTRGDSIDGGLPSVLEMLNGINPPEIHIFGNKKAIDVLTKSAKVGKQFAIEGILYVADGVILVDSVKELKK